VHPRLRRAQDVDGRDRPGHDDFNHYVKCAKVGAMQRGDMAPMMHAHGDTMNTMKK